jgi:hypothetical protein
VANIGSSIRLNQVWALIYECGAINLMVKGHGSCLLLLKMGEAIDRDAAASCTEL